MDLATGKFTGYAYSANCGWISLSNASAFVQTDTIQPGPLAPNGLPIPWLLANFGTTNVDANADPDHDGKSNREEYLAGTNPNDGNDYLLITAITRTNSIPPYVQLWWPGKATRFYGVQGRATLDPSDCGWSFTRHRCRAWPVSASIKLPISNSIASGPSGH